LSKLESNTSEKSEIKSRSQNKEKVAQKVTKNTNKKNQATSENDRGIKHILYKVNDFLATEYMMKFARYMRLAALLIVCAVLFYSPYPRGLFFERETLTAEIIVFGAFLLFWLSKIILRDKSFLKTPLDYAALTLVVVYFISIFGAVAKREAIMEWIRYCTYFAVFLMISELASEHKTRIRILGVFIASAVGVCILGLDAVSGSRIALIFNNLFEQLGLRVKFTGMTDYGRLASTFQYVNALAGYLIVAFFVAIGLTTLSEKLTKKVVLSATSFMIMLVFAHTLSRGAFLVMPLAAILYFLVLPKGSRIKGFANMLAPIIPAFILTMKLTSYMNETQFAPYVWLLVLLGCVATSIITLLMQSAVKFLEAISWKVYAGMSAAAIVVVIAVAIVALTVSAPLSLSNFDGDKNLYTSETKNVVLEPGNDYRLLFDVQAEMKADAPYSYRVEIYSRTNNDILFMRSGTHLATFSEKATDAKVTREVDFTVPTESRIVDVAFINYYPGTEAVFDNASVVDTQTGKVASGIVLNYKYMPEIVTTRLQDFTANKSGLMRQIYYKDGLALFKDYPIIGAGGGAWEFLYQKYQSYYYSTTQAHNFILQLGVETGIIGLIAFLGIVFSLVIMFAKRFFAKQKAEVDINAQNGVIMAALITAILGLLAHSMIDFDLSYTSLGILLWLLMGMFNAIYRTTEGQAVKSTKVVGKLTFYLIKITKTRQFKLYPTIGLIVAIIIGMLPINFVRAINFGEKSIAANQNGDNKTAMLHMAKANKIDKFMPEYKIDWANLIKVQENLFAENLVYADNLMVEAEKLTLCNSMLKARIGSYYLERGDIEKGIELFDKAAELRPLRPEEWQQRIGAYFNVTIACFSADRADKGLEYIDKTLMLIDDARKVNTKNLDPFIFSAATDEMLERLKYVKDNVGKQYNFALDKIVFYNVPSMDINYDGVPDQWNKAVPASVNIKYEKGIMQAINKDESIQFIRSRELEFVPGRTYTVSVFLNNCDEVESVPFEITGVTKGVETLVRNGTEYTAQVTIPEDYEPRDNYLRIGVADQIDIIIMSIIEK